MLSDSDTATSSAAVLQPHLVFFLPGWSSTTKWSELLLLFRVQTVTDKQGLELGSLADKVKVHSFLNRLLESSSKTTFQGLSSYVFYTQTKDTSAEKKKKKSGLLFGPGLTTEVTTQLKILQQPEEEEVTASLTSTKLILKEGSISSDQKLSPAPGFLQHLPVQQLQ